jgi:hypothetical protein
MKFLLIFLIVIFVIYKLSGFFMRILLSSLGDSARESFGGQRPGGERNAYGRKKHQKPMDGNVNIDYVPEQKKKHTKKSAPKFKGGEYVDYEEIRD